MTRILTALLCLLLCGCAQSAPTAQPETVPETTAVSVKEALYDPGHPVEEQYTGQIRAYPLTLRKVHGIIPMGNDILVLSGQGSTTITLYTGDDLLETASITLDFSLRQDDPSVRIHKNSISYFDPTHAETVVLSRTLQEIRRISLPDGLSGVPILSYDENTLYYCTGWSIMAWDLKNNIRRTVKELAYENQELVALHMDDQILECLIRDDGTDERLLLSSDQGLEIQALPENATLTATGSHYFTATTSGYQTLLIFGEIDKEPQLLLPEQDWDQQYYLPEDHAVVTVSLSGNHTLLNYYELNTGILRASLTLEGVHAPKNIVNTADYSVYILTHDAATNCDILYRWDVLRQTPDSSNTTSYKASYNSPKTPDTEGLEQCQEYARSIGEKYGISVRIWEDALAVRPWDYQFEPETLVPVLNKELQLLEQRLAQYPSEVLEQSKSHFTGLTICLVRKITGSADTGSLSSATGIQFFDGNEAYVIITTGNYSEQALYHALYHVMETHILTESTALDTWESLNPAGFSYGSDQQDADIYLQGQTRAFVDQYAMNSLKEDRARILENALLQENQDVFQSEYMQRKLTALCTGIREAYRLKKYPDILPWEQYLINPLTPNS